MQRRTFLQSAIAAVPVAHSAARFDLATIERPRVLKAANRYLAAEPITVTAASSPRSAGAKHDFFSEGDYWWHSIPTPVSRKWSATIPSASRYSGCE